MAKYRSRGRSNSRRSSYGYERAQQHIREADQLSVELGGTDKDVKEYFFSLNENQLSSILNEYSATYGQSAGEYAKTTMRKWESGQVHMSGMVAGRLFSLLPKLMPLDAKLRLTESLWKHVAPKSQHKIYVNPETPVEIAVSEVSKLLQKEVVSYKIPQHMERRFSWLAQGDVGVKQQLLNHIRAKEKELAARSLSTNLPILSTYLKNNEALSSKTVSHTLTVGNNELVVVVTNKVDGVTQTAPIENTTDYWSWFWILGVIIMILLIFST